MAAYVPLNERALEAFDVLAAGGVTAPTHRATNFLACFAARAPGPGAAHGAGADPDAGQDVTLPPGRRLAGARPLEPALTDRVGAAVQIYGQRYLHPPEYVRSLAFAVRARGGEIVEGVDVTDLRTPIRRGLRGRRDRRAASARRRRGRHRCRARRAGRAIRRPAAGPGRPRLQLQRADRAHATRPAVLPEAAGGLHTAGRALRVAGMMEFRRPGDPLDPRRIQAIVDAVRPFLTGVDLDDRRNEWVGSRPCTPDGLPLIGATASPRVFVAGGHGMWGIALGPITGQLMAQAVLKGETPPELAPFDPLR